MQAQRRRTRVAFALCAALAIVSLFVLDGAAAGATSLLAMLAFIAACISALRGHDRDAVARSQRTSLTGWFGGWF